MDPNGRCAFLKLCWQHTCALVEDVSWQLVLPSKRCESIITRALPIAPGLPCIHSPVQPQPLDTEAEISDLSELAIALRSLGFGVRDDLYLKLVVNAANQSVRHRTYGLRRLEYIVCTPSSWLQHVCDNIDDLLHPHGDTTMSLAAC